MLLEALIAILIFSLGVLAVVAMQAIAVKQATEARYRTEASLLVDQLVGTMWASDRASAALAATFNTGNSGYNTWLTAVTNTLPGVGAGTAPTVAVDSATGMVTIVVYWRQPSDAPAAPAHRYIAVAQIK